MPRIFISYRRSDSEDISGRIYDRLVKAFGKNNIFLDVGSIPLGADFREVLQRSVADSDIVLVIIGKTWADTATQARLNDPDDFVRIEVETALRLPDKRVIPVLVNAAKMPAASDLPSTLAKLPFRNAATVNTPSFDRDMESLIQRIRTRRLSPVPFVIAALLVGIAAIFLVSQGALTPSSTPTQTLQAAVASESPTDSPTLTTAPTDRPTDTPIPPSATSTATHTDVPPTATPTYTASPSATHTVTPTPPRSVVSPTPISADQNTRDFALTIFRDTDSFTLYVPVSSDPYSLAGLTFQVTDVANQLITYQLDRDFPAFQGMPFTNITALNQVLCFKLEYQEASTVLPTDCSRALLLNQDLAATDIFWYDRSTNQARTVIVLKDGATLGICAAGQSTCVIGDLTTTQTSQPTVVSASATPGYPCEAMIVVKTGGLLNQVRLSPQSSAPSRTIQEGSTVTIMNYLVSEAKDWYQLSYSDNPVTGWILSEYVVLSEGCP